MDLKSEHKSLEQKAYEVIKDMILFGKLKPTERLKEAGIAKELGVSRTTVTKAFIRLKSEYLIEDNPTQGVQVRILTSEEGLEAFEIREVLEGVAARIAARKMPDEDIDMMITRFEDYNQQPESENKEEYERLNFSLHQKISDCCVNRTVSKLIVMMTLQTRSFSKKYPIYKPTKKLNKKHLDILYALKKKDEKLAETLMRNHIRDIRTAFIKIIEQNEIFEEVV